MCDGSSGNKGETQDGTDVSSHKDNTNKCDKEMYGLNIKYVKESDSISVK